MPTYEYECKNCDHSFEIFQAMSDAPLKDCPQCGKELRRLIYGGSGVIFKGSGFYVTDKNKAAASAKPAKPCEAIKAGSPSCANCPAQASADTMTKTEKSSTVKAGE